MIALVLVVLLFAIPALLCAWHMLKLARVCAAERTRIADQGVELATDHEEGCEVGPYRFGRCAKFDRPLDEFLLVDVEDLDEAAP